MPVTYYHLARSLALHHYIIDARHDSLTNYRAGNYPLNLLLFLQNLQDVSFRQIVFEIEIYILNFIIKVFSS